MIERWLALWYWPAPALRLACFRALVGAFAVFHLLTRYVGFTRVASLQAWEFSPVGAARLLSAPLPKAWVVAAVLATIVLGVAFSLGFRYRITAPAFALLLLGVTSYRSSWGMLFHTDNLLVLHVLLLAVAPAAHAFSLDALAARRAAGAASTVDPWLEDGRYGWAIRAACVLTVVTYFVAGVAKLKLGGLAWLDGEQLRQQIAYDNLRKIELGRGASALGVWFVRHPVFFPPLAALTLLIELGAPLALLHRRVAVIWVIAAWSFHLGVAVLMNITFPYPLSFVPYLAFLRLELWAQTPLGRTLLQRLRLTA